MTKNTKDQIKKCIKDGRPVDQIAEVFDIKIEDVVKVKEEQIRKCLKANSDRLKKENWQPVI